jgi:hypothetical protein
LANAAVFETNTAEADGILKAKEAIGSALQSDYLQAWQDRFAKTQQAIQHELLILETEGKTKKAAAEKKYQKIKVLELELQTILASIPSAFRYKTNNEKLNTELKYQEKLISTAADKYATTFADFAEQQYGFSYNFNTVAPNEKSFSTGNPISAAIASVPKSTGHTYMVSGRNIVRSKDKEHITISISDTDKEISICLPNDTQEATMATLKQLEAAGVLAIEPKLNKQPKAAMPKKPRVIVSL